MFPRPFPGMSEEDARALHQIFLQAQHYPANSSEKKKPTDADRARKRKALLKQFKSWKLVESGKLDLGRGEQFRYGLSGHDPYENVQRGGMSRRRWPYAKDAFGLLLESKRTELSVQAWLRKADYRQNLLKEYRTVFEIENLPAVFLQSSGVWFTDIRSEFQKQLATDSQQPNGTHSENPSDSPNTEASSQPPSKFDPLGQFGRAAEQPTRQKVWEGLTPGELGAVRALKTVLDELVEITCCGHAVAGAFDCDDSRGSICKHASRALTPFLPLCSDEQLGKLVPLIGAWDEGEYVFHFAKDMFTAWDYPRECPWVWDIILETSATITKGSTEDFFDNLRPILSQCEPWGGPMHEEHKLACAVALLRDNFGMEKIREELRQGRGGPMGDPGTRSWVNASIFSELKRLRVADADNLVIKASKLEAYTESLDGHYLGWLKELGLPASNEARIAIAKASVQKSHAAPGTDVFRERVAENEQQVRRWLESTGGRHQTSPEAKAKEALAAARRTSFDKAAKRLLAKDTPTAADIRKELAEFQKTCEALEAETTRKEAGGGSNPSVIKVCDHCGEKAKEGKKLQRCGGCKKAKYCGRDCQAAAWRAGHREACKEHASSA